jgi:hypothetical protein
MDDIEIVAGSKIEWVLDSVSPKTIRARHLGRPISFEYFSTKEPTNYESVQVLGVLDGVIGSDILVSGDLYDGDRIAHAKSHRKKLA